MDIYSIIDFKSLALRIESFKVINITKWTNAIFPSEIKTRSENIVISEF